MFPLPSTPFTASFPHLTNLSSPPQLSVSVDGIHSKKGTTAGPFSQLSSSRLHLGGADVPALLPGAETRSNFVGCMKKVRKSGFLLSRANTYLRVFYLPFSSLFLSPPILSTPLCLRLSGFGFSLPRYLGLPVSPTLSMSPCLFLPVSLCLFGSRSLCSSPAFFLSSCIFFSFLFLSRVFLEEGGRERGEEESGSARRSHLSAYLWRQSCLFRC